VSFLDYINQTCEALLDAERNGRIIVLDRRPLEAPVFHAPMGKKPEERVRDYFDRKIDEGYHCPTETWQLVKQTRAFYDFLAEFVLGHEDTYIAEPTFNEFQTLLDLDKNNWIRSKKRHHVPTKKNIRARRKIAKIADKTLSSTLKDKSIPHDPSCPLNLKRPYFHSSDKRTSDFNMFTAGIRKASSLGKEVEYWSQDTHIIKFANRWNKIQTLL
tara:strand:+ start:1109 stop:1753 length:645 start_codon:yes stop_codon:yes gene_type:complete